MLTTSSRLSSSLPPFLSSSRRVRFSSRTNEISPLPLLVPAILHSTHTASMRCLLAGGWQPPSASAFSPHVDASVPSPRCGWPPQHRAKQPARAAVAGATSANTGVRWLSYSTLALETSQAAHVPAAAEEEEAGRRRNRSVVTSSTTSSAAASEHEQTKLDKVDDLAALLDVLELTERDILPEMSKRNQALLGLGQEREGLMGLGGGEAQDRSSGGKSSAPWVMLEEVGMKPAEVAAVVTAYPLLLTLPAKHARTVVGWLAGRAGLSSKQMVRVIKSHPGILRYDVKSRLEPHAQWLEGEGLTTRASIAKVLSKLPQMLGLSIESNLSPKTAWLQSYLGLSADGVASVLRSFPAVLALNVENLQGKAAWLERRLDVDRQAVSKILKLNPSLFGSSVENSLGPKLAWLREGLGLEERDIALVVRACPNLLSYSVEENLEPTMAWLQNRMHLDQKGVAAMVRTFPSVLGLNPEKNIEPKLAWLMENIDLDEELVLGLVKTCPQLFGCSAKSNLGPTLSFFRKELGGTREEIRELVLSNPTLLRYSLKKRMIPRAAVIKEAGLGPPVFRQHVKPIAAYTDLAFDKWLDSLILNRGMPPRQNSTAKAGAASAAAARTAAAGKARAGK